MAKQSRNTGEETEIRDIEQQVWVLQGKSLIATPDNGQVNSVILLIYPCKSEDSLDKNKDNPLYMGIKDQDLCLSCEENQGKATLKLEDKKIRDLYLSPKTQKAFVFYRTSIGNTSTFESAACPGWFISTSVHKGEYIKMTNDSGKQSNINFYLDIIETP